MPGQAPGQAPGMRPTGMNGQDPFNNGMQPDPQGQGDGPSGNANSLLMQHLKDPTGPRAPVGSVPGTHGSPIRPGMNPQCPPTSSAAGGMPATSAPLLNAQLKKQNSSLGMNADPSVIKEVGTWFITYLQKVKHFQYLMFLFRSLLDWLSKRQAKP